MFNTEDDLSVFKDMNVKMSREQKTLKEILFVEQK